MDSTLIFTIILFLILDLLIIYYIIITNQNINTYTQTESTGCPTYYCDIIKNPSTDEVESGSYCYSNKKSENNYMVAYRYTDKSKREYYCQNFNLNSNVVFKNN